MSAIISAMYGNSDVTSLVSQIPDEVIVVSNGALGGDPLEGVYKYLSLQFDDDTSRVSGEGQQIRLKNPIIQANYWGIDVTNIVLQLREQDSVIVVSNDILGGDPQEGVYKYLSVQFADLSTRVAGEGQKLVLK